MKRVNTDTGFNLFEWVVIIGTTVIISLVIVFAIVWNGKNSEKKEAPEEETTVETVEEIDTSNFYGTRDGRSFEDPDLVKFDYGYGRIDFKTLDIPLDKDVQEFTYYLCYAYYVDYPLVLAIMESESGFNPNAESTTSDSGLMQINAINKEWLAEKLNVTDLYNPYENVRAGVYILRMLFERYDDPSLVLMAYGFGETGASRLWNEGIVETGYTQKLINRANEFQVMLNAAD